MKQEHAVILLGVAAFARRLRAKTTEGLAQQSPTALGILLAVAEIADVFVDTMREMDT